MRNRKPMPDTDIENNPVNGDNLFNCYWSGNKTRHVIGRTLGGDVIYLLQRGAKGAKKCTLEEWKQYCAVARVLKKGKREKS